ncbi:MAG: helix-turn-helix domain-containing protein, partial [Terriglobia bacterium]
MRGNGGDLFDYDVGQLPAEWQERIRAREARRGQGAGNQETTAALALSSSQPISQPAAPASAAGLSPAPSPRRGNDGGEGGGHPTVALSLFPAAALTEKEQHELEALPSKQQEQAIERHQAIKPATQREWQALPAAQRRTLRRERLMRQLAERAGVGVRTIRRWVSRYDRGGICALADRKRRDEGDTSLMRAQQRYLIVLYDSQEQRSIRECWQLLCLDIDAGGLEGPKPSYGVCKAFLRRHNPAVIKELFREGEKRFYDRHDPWAQRDVSQLPPNYWWMADFWERDVRTRSPQERLHRRWRCVIQDIRSRAWVGWAEGDVPSTQLFKSALGRAINTHGLPGYWDDQGAFQLGHLSIDNGKEFISKEALGKPKRWRFDVAEDKELTGFLGLLGFDTAEPERPSNLHRTQPRNSRGKSYIESSFNLLARFDRRLPGATGNRSHNKPEKLAAEERLHKEYCEGLRPETLLLTDEDAGKALDLFMEWCNWGRRHGATKATPGQIMARGKPHPKPEPAALEILLWYRRQVKVRGDKVTVRFGSVARTFAHDKLLLLSGEMVEVHCDPANPDLALVFHRGRPY